MDTKTTWIPLEKNCRNFQLMSRQYVHEENITIPQGTDFQEIISISGRDGKPLNLSGISSFAGRMRTDYAYYITPATDFPVSLNNATNGVVEISFASSDVVGFTTSGQLWRLVEGRINLTARVY